MVHVVGGLNAEYLVGCQCFGSSGKTFLISVAGFFEAAQNPATKKTIKTVKIYLQFTLNSQKFVFFLTFLGFNLKEGCNNSMQFEIFSADIQRINRGKQKQDEQNATPKTNMNPKRMIFLSTMWIFGGRVSFRMYIFLLRLLWMIHIPLSKEGTLGCSPF